MKIRNSQPFVFIVFVLAIFIVGFAFVVLDKPLEVVYNKFYNDSDLTDDVYQTFFTRTKTMWEWMLLPIGIMLIIWVIVKMQQKNDYEGGLG